MPIELSNTNISAKLLKVGDGNFEMVAGKVLKIETSPSGSEFLNATVPLGKVWQVLVYVSIEETDAQ